MRGWSHLLAEAARGESRGKPIRAYSEFMPPPRVALKPSGEVEPFTRPEGDEHGFNVHEWDEAEELRPGLEWIASRLVDTFLKLARGERSPLTRAMLASNPAWPGELSSRASSLPPESLVVVLPLALSRTHDDKGRVRWTVFGASHEGPARGFWKSFAPEAGAGGESRFLSFVSWALRTDPRGDAGPRTRSFLVDPFAAGVRVLPTGPDAELGVGDEEIPAFARRLVIADDAPLDGVAAIVTVRAFERLPEKVRAAYLDGKLRLIPSPESLVFWGHAGFRKLAASLPRAIQIPLLQMLPNSDYGVRMPATGWLDEGTVQRHHRFQHVERDADDTDEPTLDDRVSIALFSNKPDDLGLYGKPMAKNAQVWTEKFELLLDGPRAGRDEIQAAARQVSMQRCGYRFWWPPMHAGERALFWHRPLIARVDPGGIALLFDGPLGWITAEKDGEAPVELWPRMLAREARSAAAAIFDREHPHRRRTTTGNVRKLLETYELLGRKLEPSFARRLLTAAEDVSLDRWFASLLERASDRERAEKMVAVLASVLGDELADPGKPLTYEATATRDFEERYWRAIAQLSEGDLRAKNVADPVDANAGRSGGALAGAAIVVPERQLELVGDYLQRWYRELIKRHGMAGKAFAGEHRFRWETEFEMPWSEAWRRNEREPAEKNLVVVIPGRDRSQAIVMADHYDTAYMEDVYDPARGGDRHRSAAPGADDNASATAALQLAADVLLPMSRDGLLERDVWLVHLTGEEFPADCLGARELARRLVARDLTIDVGGSEVDLSRTRVAGAFVLDMVSHNNEKHRDVFQVAPGEGRAATRLAWKAWRANERWNAGTKEWNAAPERRSAGRFRRSAIAAQVPAIAPHPKLVGEVRPEWDPRSALYNTDAQILSDAGIPVVLFMENYDIRRAGYHDSQDTMANIDLDYGAALVAIAIETVADCATSKD